MQAILMRAIGVDHRIADLFRCVTFDHLDRSANRVLRLVIHAQPRGPETRLHRHLIVSRDNNRLISHQVHTINVPIRPNAVDCLLV